MQLSRLRGHAFDGIVRGAAEANRKDAYPTLAHRDGRRDRRAVASVLIVLHAVREQPDDLLRERSRCRRRLENALGGGERADDIGEPTRLQRIDRAVDLRVACGERRVRGCGGREAHHGSACIRQVKLLDERYCDGLHRAHVVKH